LLGLFGFYGITFDLAVELYVVLYDLSVTYDDEHINIIFESDSRVTLDLIMSNVQPHHPFASLISQIVQLHSRDWIVNFHYTLYQGNECTNWLAKHDASSSDALIVLNFLPPQLHHSLFDYVLGVTHIRL